MKISFCATSTITKLNSTILTAESFLKNYGRLLIPGKKGKKQITGKAVGDTEKKKRP